MKALVVNSKGLIAAAVLGAATLGLVLAAPWKASAQQTPPALTPAAITAAEGLFNQSCAICHGQNAVGGDRAPGLVDTASLRAMDQQQIAAIIRTGTTRGMPGFGTMPDAQITQLAVWLKSKNISGVRAAAPEQIAAGEKFFFGEGQCATCHMVKGQGASNGPDLTAIGVRATPEDITKMLDDPTGQMGTKRTAACPGWAFCPNLEWNVANVTLRNGQSLRGFLRNEAEHNLNLQTFDGKMHLLSAGEYTSYARETVSYMPPLRATPEQRRDLMAYLSSLGAVVAAPAPRAASFTPQQIQAANTQKPGEWPSYHGGVQGNRFSPLDQINASNVSRLRPAFIFSPGGTGLQTTPVVVDGVMYVTGAQQTCALDAKTGLSIWCASRLAGQSQRAGGVAAPQRNAGAPAPPSAAARPFGGVATGNGPNRGVAIMGDRVYVQTDDAYLMALNRLTGGVVWIVPLTDPTVPGLYYATGAPMIAGDLVVAGVAGTPGARGFLAAFKASTGELAWRFWNIPKPTDPNASTWVGDALEKGTTGGAGTWMTGSYDSELGLVYWGTANPDPSNNGDQRQGRNLYANTILALEAKTGKLKWFYQPTPHDLHDWDATQPLVLVDEMYQGQRRKLLMQANRNGFFYVLDRTNGRLLMAKPFVKKMDWASGVGPDGMPILLPDYAPTDEGHLKCPAVRGATNWFSTSYNPGTKLFYVMAAEDCSFFRKTGRQYAPNPNMKDPGKRFLRALDINTAAVVWEKPLTGSNEANYSGVLSTAGNLVFHGETAGGFAAVDATSGRTLWSFPANDAWRASPMTYSIGGKQYVAVAAGANVIAFTLPD